MDKIEVLYEDNNLMVINKPAGLVIHADGRNNQETLVDWILEKYPEVNGVGEELVLTNGIKINRPGIVHRLDKETSGVLILAKHQESFNFLKKQFQDREIKKTYQAITYGNFPKNNGVINKPIGRNKNDFRRWQAGDKARGNLREAVTEYKVLKRSPDKQFTFLEIYPKTGRTHQIRVHLKSIHHPVVCDSLYASSMVCPEGLSRMALHARSIEFKALDGETLKIEAPLPKDIQNTADLLF